MAAAGHWREDKVALLLAMRSTAAEADPCPDIPAGFLDVVRIPKLARQLKKNVRASEDAVANSDEPEAAAEVLREHAYEPPKVRTRQVVASRGCWPAFAPVVAAAAWTWAFQGAARRAFVGDGSANNWTLQRRFFGSFVPILDFIHALSYVFAAATTVLRRRGRRKIVVMQPVFLPGIGRVTQERVQIAKLAAGATQHEMADFLLGIAAGFGPGGWLRSQPHLALLRYATSRFRQLPTLSVFDDGDAARAFRAAHNRKSVSACLKETG